MWDKLKAEFDRAPMATLCAPLGVIAGIGGMVVGYLQLNAATHFSGASSTSSVEGAVRDAPNGSIAIIVVGVFLALTPSFASIVRIFYKVNRFAAVPSSIVIAAISIFLNRLNAIVLGYGTQVKPNSAALDNLMFYGTVVIFLAVAGRAPLIDLSRPVATGEGSGKMSNEDAVGTLALVVITTLIWGGLVGWSQQQMSQAFL